MTSIKFILIPRKKKRRKKENCANYYPKQLEEFFSWELFTKKEKYIIVRNDVLTALFSTTPIANCPIALVTKRFSRLAKVEDQLSEDPLSINDRDDISRGDYTMMLR